MPIHLLTEDVINKIAAGEVIERPASVVKELIENSIDANATRILVEIESSGKERICITDNGEGMSEQDARKSILRHATSKITSADDLFSINTLGFRGEALASIAAVSHFSLLTKPAASLAGFNLIIEGGAIISSGIAAAEQGTVIEVRDIFYNTPARKKFLKTDAVELRHIIDVVTHYALINPHISFRLLHNSHELLKSPSTSEWRSNIASLYGIDLARELLEIQATEEGISLQGFICKPYHARNDKHQQAFFVNTRWIKNHDLVKAVYDGYHSLLFVNRHPLFVLHLQLDPTKIDVNVHPHKSEIRIEQKERICEFIRKTVHDCLQQHQLLPSVNLQMEQQTSSSVSSKRSTYRFEPSTQTVLHVKEAAAASYLSDMTPETPVPQFSLPPSSSPSFSSTSSSFSYPAPSPSTFPELRLLGQIHKTFFVAETHGGVFFIDQHAAHERVMYEQLMAQLNQGNIETQELLKGEILDLTPVEAVLCRDFQTQFEEMGFRVENFGGQSFILKTSPAVFGRQQVRSMFMEILHAIEDNKNKVHELRELIITRMACRAAVMAGEELTSARMEKILAQLRETQLPYTCPHGRPTLLKTTADELEKKFKRKG
ncbi:DNA mismatch repair endonuclease MutL [Candidatus Woesearchaeota archaeon]|nr:DNA mismatch repair endonuclease MutL [Candidatus Woesearchaeota archaeon]